MSFKISVHFKSWIIRLILSIICVALVSFVMYFLLSNYNLNQRISSFLFFHKNEESFKLNPCDDFYEYVCNDWIANQTDLYDQVFITKESKFISNIDDEIRMLLENNSSYIESLYYLQCLQKGMIIKFVL